MFTLPAEPDAPRPDVAESSGFSLHAGIAVKASQRDKIERLARYVSRPPVAAERLSLTRGGNVCYALKTLYRDGITHVIFEPEDFIAQLAALVPKPRAHLLENCKGLHLVVVRAQVGVAPKRFFVEVC